MTDKLRRGFTAIDVGLLLAIIIPIVGILPTFGAGLANGADAPFHAHRMYALSELIQDGNLYPRWVSYFHMGYGYPVFNFYAPLASHIGAWIHLLGFDIPTAYNLTNALSWIIGSMGMYLLARTFLTIPSALLACVIWVYAPSRFYEFWWQGSIAQIVATSFVPFVFYGIIRTAKSPNLKNSLWIAIPFALIILSHTPTTYMSAIFIAPFCFFVALPYKSFTKIVRRWIYIGSGLAISAGLSAIFLIPVFAEVEFVRIAGELPDTIAFLRAGFTTFNELFSTPSLIDSLDVTLVMPRTLGLVGGILSMIGIVALFKQRKFLIAGVLVLGLGFAVFLALEPSLDLWLLIPSFRNLRFPERILRIGAVFIALLGASSILLLPRRFHFAGLIILSIVIIGQALPIMHPRDDDRVWENLSALDEIQMEHRENNWGTTAYDEYEPVWGEVTLFDMPHDAETYIAEPFKIRFFEADYLVETNNISYSHLSDNEIKVAIDADDLPMRFRQFYFPGWQAWLDEEPFLIEPDERYGLIEMNIPNGEHVIRLEYIGTPIQHISTAISLITVLGCFIIVFQGRGATSDSGWGESSLLLPQLAGVFTGGLLLFSVFNTLWLQDNVFRIQAEPDTPHYMQQTVNQTFDERVTLLGYTLDSDVIHANNPFGIRLYWKLEQATDAEYRPVVQLVNLNISDSWAVSQPLEFEGGKLSDISLEQFMSDSHRLRLFDDAPPYVAQLSIQLQRIDPDQARTTILTDGRDRFILPEIIPIDKPSEPYKGQSQNIEFGDILTSHCIGLAVENEKFEIDMIWQVKQPPTLDYQMFVHGLNAEGEIVQQVDVSPLSGLYPTSLWRESQVLYDTVGLAFDESIMTIAVGLYNPADIVRVPVKLSNGTITDSIDVSVEDETCQ